MTYRLSVLVKAMIVPAFMFALSTAQADIPRTAEVLVDLTGTYDVATRTPLQRPVIYGKVYEYACHEANYVLGNVLRGARLLEANVQWADAGGE